MPLLPALRAFFTRLLTDADDALFPQHVFCLTCGALSLPNAICPVCLAVLDDLRLPSDALAPNAAAVWSYHGIARQLVLMLKYSGIAECAQVLAGGLGSARPLSPPPRHSAAVDPIARFAILRERRDAFLWSLPLPAETLARNGLVSRECVDCKKRCRDVLIYRKDYHLDAVDQRFVETLRHAGAQLGRCE